MLTKYAVGTFSNYEKTEIALRELKDNGFLMERVSIVGREIDSQTEIKGINTSNRIADFGNLDTNDNQAKETAIDGAIAGITVGGFTGLLVGLASMAIPGVGPVMLAGAAASALISTLSGGVIGGVAGSLAGGLVGLGIPADRAKVYSDRVAQGHYLVMIEGSEADIALAEPIFNRHGINDWYVYDSQPNEPARTVTTTAAPRLRV